MARHRRGLSVRIGHDGFDVKNAWRLSGVRALQGEHERRENQRTEHDDIVLPAPEACQTIRPGSRPVIVLRRASVLQRRLASFARLAASFGSSAPILTRIASITGCLASRAI